MKQITVKAKITHTEEVEREITLPFYGIKTPWSTRKELIAAFDQDISIEIILDDYYTTVQEKKFDVSANIENYTEITKEEFDANFSEAIMKIGAVADKHITVPEWNLSDPEPNTSMIESLETADELPTL
jgi:hypothetical protein